MMREMKDHELEQVFGGRSEAEIGVGLADSHTVQFADTKFTEKHMTVPAQAAPFLLPNPQLVPFVRRFSELSEARPTGRRALWRALAEAHPQGGLAVSDIKQQTSKGGPFTFKTPYLNR